MMFKCHSDSGSWVIRRERIWFKGLIEHRRCAVVRMSLPLHFGVVMTSLFGNPCTLGCMSLSLSVCDFCHGHVCVMSTSDV